MATKKKTVTRPPKNKIAKPPTVNERITDFSTGASSNFRYVPKKKK